MRSRIFHRLALAEASVISRQNLNGAHAKACAETNEMRRIAARGTLIKIDWRGLSDRVSTAMVEYTDETGHILPWNLNNLVHAGLTDGYPRRVHPNRARRVEKDVARFCGWLRSAAEFPGLRRLIATCTSPLGQCSPRTTVNLWDLWRRYPSPGRLEYVLWQVRKRAANILRGYEGTPAPSWRATGACLGGHTWGTRATGPRPTGGRGRLNRLAIRVAAATLLGGDPSYREATASLVDLRAFGIKDASDGVPVMRTTDPVYTAPDGVAAYPYVRKRGYAMRERGILCVRPDGRTYHETVKYSPSREDLTGLGSAVVEWARQEWARQDRALEAAGAARAAIDGTTGYIPLVHREDSYAAGNCRPGTEAWLRSMGWARREWIPAVWLLPHLGNDHVQGVVGALTRRPDVWEVMRVY